MPNDFWCFDIFYVLDQMVWLDLYPLALGITAMQLDISEERH